jgi:hypothetical protein
MITEQAAIFGRCPVQTLAVVLIDLRLFVVFVITVEGADRNMATLRQ